MGGIEGEMCRSVRRRDQGREVLSGEERLAAEIEIGRRCQFLGLERG